VLLVLCDPKVEKEPVDVSKFIAGNAMVGQFHRWSIDGDGYFHHHNLIQHSKTNYKILNSEISKLQINPELSKNVYQTSNNLMMMSK